MAYSAVFMNILLLASDVFTGYVRTMEHSYENSFVLTTVPVSPWTSNANQIYVIPGTPYDLARNESYYLYHYHLSKPDQRNSKLHGCKTDYSRRVLYMYDEKVARIEAVPNFDWRNQFASITSIVRMHVGVSIGGTKIAVDWVSHNIYWTDPMFRWIAMQPGDTANIDSDLYKLIVKEDINKPSGLAVDPLGGFIFWTDIADGIAEGSKIERATLTGENRLTIISSGLLSPVCIEVDYQVSESKRRIYWADASLDKLESANLSGGERRLIKQMLNTKFHDMALFRDVLSVLDVQGDKVYFINKLSGQEMTKPYSRPYFRHEEIWGICMYDNETQPLSTDHCGTARCSDLCVSVRGNAICLCREGYKLSSDGYSCIEDTSKYHRALVLADSHSIYLADIRCLTAAYSNYPQTEIYNTNETIQFLTVDMIERKVIFATSTDVYFIAVDAASPVAQHIVTSQQSITGLSLNWIDKKIYWTSGEHISFMSQESGQSSTLLSGLINPRGIVILTIDKKMVWITGAIHSRTIEIADLAGTQRKTLIHSTMNPKSLSYDSHTKRLYWVDSGSGTIKRVNIDGTDLETLPVKTVSSPELCLIYKDYLAWTEAQYPGSIIRTANAREPSQRLYSDSFAGMSRIVVLNVLDETLQRQKEVQTCSNDIPNGEITGPCSYLPQSNCSYTCDDNYRPAIDSQVLLCFNGHWHETVPCVISVSQCTNDIQNGRITGACSYLTLSNCSYTCDDNYLPVNDSSVLWCVNGHWHEKTPCVASVISASSHLRWFSHGVATKGYMIWLVSYVALKAMCCI